MNLVIFNENKGKIDVIEMAPGIKRIERYSAFIMVVYENHIEFVLFEKRALFETASKISLNEEILNVQPDITHQRFVFVQTSNQIYLYDCDPLMQQQYAQLNPIQQQVKGCIFVRKIFTSTN